MTEIVKRDEVVDRLVRDDILIGQEDETYLYNILKSGFVGYEHFTDKELEDEYNERLDADYEGIKIT